MGYHVSITRARHGVESPISLQEWLDHVAASDELELETGDSDDVARKFLLSNHAARWRGSSDGCLAWSNGEIWTKNPSEDLLRYMAGIAPRFGAHVRGDEGEFYREDGDAFVEKDGRDLPWEDAEAERVADFKRRRRIKRTIKIVLLAVAIGIAVLKAIND